MANDNFRTWYIAGLHALRSASEQGAAGAKALQDRAGRPDLAAAVQTYGATARDHRVAITGFLRALDTAPNDFKDRIMEGVGNGTGEMVKAAPDQDMLDLSIVSGNQSGIHYYISAFDGASKQAGALGLTDQADGFAQMSETWRAIEQQYSRVAQPIMKRAAA